MTLSAVVGGTVYSRALSVSVSRDVRNFLGWFQITSSPSEFNNLPIKSGDKVQIINGQRDILLTGFVESIDIRYSAGDHQIVASGRDITADLVDSTLRVKQYRGPIKFDGFVNRVMSEQGLVFPLIVESDQVGEIGKDEILTGETGQGVMDFLEVYARRAQLVLTSGPTGTVNIIRAGKSTVQQSIINIPGNPLTNVVECSMRLNNSYRYSEYSCTSQLSVVAGTVDAETETVINQRGLAEDKGARKGRFFEFEAERSMDSNVLSDRAKLESNLRQARAISYSAKFANIFPEFEINKKVRIDDTICGMRGSFLIASVKHSFDLQSGAVTEIEVTSPNAYSLEADLNEIQSTRSDVGEGF